LFVPDLNDQSLSKVASLSFDSYKIKKKVLRFAPEN